MTKNDLSGFKKSLGRVDEIHQRGLQAPQVRVLGQRPFNPTQDTVSLSEGRGQLAHAADALKHAVAVGYGHRLELSDVFECVQKIAARPSDSLFRIVELHPEVRRLAPRVADGADLVEMEGFDHGQLSFDKHISVQVIIPIGMPGVMGGPGHEDGGDGDPVMRLSAESSVNSFLGGHLQPARVWGEDFSGQGIIENVFALDKEPRLSSQTTDTDIDFQKSSG